MPSAQLSRAKRGAAKAHALIEGRSKLFAALLVMVGGGLIFLVAGVSIEDPWEAVLRDFGIAGVIAGGLGSVYEWKLREDYRGDLETELREILDEDKSFRATGLVRVHEEITRKVLKDRLEQAEQEKADLKLLDIWAGLDHAASQLQQVLKSKRCKAKVLLRDPNATDLITYRAKDLRHTSLQDAILAELETLVDTPGCEVKVYDALPAFQLWDFGSTKLLGLYWSAQRSSSGVQFEIRDGSALAKDMDEHFEKVWDAETTRDGRTAVKNQNGRRQHERGGE